jgi:hypothetical protein
MRNYMTKVGLGAIGLALLAGASFAVSLSVQDVSKPSTIAGHSSLCRVCQLPLHGHDGSGSQLGPELREIPGAAELVR